MQNEQNNPLTGLGFEIPFDAIQARHVVPAITELIADARARLDRVVDHEGPRTYENTLGAIEDATEELERASSVVGHLELVATSDEYRLAYQEAQPLLSAFWTGLILDEGLWRALLEFQASDEAARLDPVRARHLKLTVDEFRRHGAQLDDAGKERIQEINTELAEATTRFSQNLLDATNAFELIIEEEPLLAGLPTSAREAAAESARKKEREGWRFTLQAPSLVPLLTYLADAGTRETVWTANMSRATADPFDNRPLIQQILSLRKEKAELLGYRDFSDLVLENRMAGDGARAWRFVDDLRSRTIDRFQAENGALAQFRATTDEHQSGEMRPWDVGYFAEKQRLSLFDFDEEELRPYFPVDLVIEGLFELARRLYDVEVEPVEGMPTWDPAVQTYRMTDGEQHLASFYFDLYPRENKRGGAWMNSLITAEPGKPHLGLMCANVTPPLGDKPALLTHREVETLFHEFGHLLHHCLSEVPVRSLSGTNVAWDFVELPSQIMENWCWERESIDTFARHWQTGEPVPHQLFEKLLQTRTYRAANAQMRQLSLAHLDLGLHREFRPGTDHDVIAYSREILQQYTPVQLPAEYGFPATFGHLFSNSVGYAAGYYSYKWAEVLDADAFTKFRDAGVFDRATGMRFRRTILATGDSADPADLYRSFMGRDPDQSALMERLGLQ